MIELPRRSRPNVNADINIVPYIDVMLVLLVIFMMTTPIIEQGVEVDLPQTDANMVEYTKDQPTVITIDKQGDYFINSLQDATAELTEEGERVSINVAVNRVIARLQIWPEMKVFVRGDKNIDYGRVVELMALLQQNGVDKVGLVTENPN